MGGLMRDSGDGLGRYTTRPEFVSGPSTQTVGAPAASDNWTSTTGAWKSGRVTTVRVDVVAQAAQGSYTAAAQLPAGFRPTTGLFFVAVDNDTGAPVPMVVDATGGIFHAVSRSAGQRTLGSITYVNP